MAEAAVNDIKLVTIGNTFVFLNQGQEEGSLYVTVTPCTANGQSLDEDSFIEEPQELLGKPYYFKVCIIYN